MSETYSSTLSSFEKSKSDSSKRKNKKRRCKRKHNSTTAKSESTTNSTSSSSQQSSEQETSEKSSTIKLRRIAPTPAGKHNQKGKKKKKEKFIKANNHRQPNIAEETAMQSVSQQIMEKYRVKPKQDCMKRCADWLNSQPDTPLCSGRNRRKREEKCLNRCCEKEKKQKKRKSKKKAEKWYEKVNTPTMSSVPTSTGEESSGSSSGSVQEQVKDESRGDSGSTTRKEKDNRRRKRRKDKDSSSSGGKFILMEMYRKNMKDKMKKKRKKENKKGSKKPKPSAAVKSKDKSSGSKTCTRCKLLHYESKLKKRKPSDRLYERKHRSGKYISKTRRPVSPGWAVIKAVNLIEAKGKEVTPKLVYHVVTKKLDKPELTKLNVYGLLKWMLKKKILTTERVNGKRTFKNKLVTKGANKKQMKAVRSLFREIPTDISL